MEKTMITISAVVNAPLQTVWECWNQPEHIMKWNFAIDSWHCPAASNDPKVGGRLTCTMAAKDGSVSFEFGGTYTALEEGKHIAYTMDDERTVDISFNKSAEGVEIIETFEAESENPVEMQKGGWQAILNNFKAYVENPR
ncbi:SRPBCC family protein [Marinoscillum sp. MHG1-6]|uniref:SRPBCC family protein n=1 Tax=Marinoscillum sp. MHG1-6 TaxID=2959627 RepID=UPI0021576495|nr:SRPBCC family protein [Marinoscillum sp. MHG1-6]